MNAKDAILYLYDKGLLNIDAIMKNKDSIMQELDNTTEKLTKHDPCRLFKKGDKVRVVKCKGRNYTGQTTGEIGIVDRDESPGTASVEVEFADEDMWEIDPAYLELVTPVEELGPYSVRHNEVHAAWSIYGPYNLSAVNYFYGERYPYTEESAKAAAEAERDRLNEEWRKEQNND